MIHAIKTAGLAIGAIVLAAVAMASYSNSTQAQSLSDEQLETIVYRCARLRTTIRRLQTLDSVTRVELGKNYESMLTRLMVPMNSRLVNNHIDAGDMLGVTASFSDNLSGFRRAYTSYDQSIRRLLNIDCTRRPADFHYQLQVARDRRNEVRSYYLRLNGDINDYREELRHVAHQID